NAHLYLPPERTGTAPPCLRLAEKTCSGRLCPLAATFAKNQFPLSEGGPLMKTTPNISKIRLHSLAAILSRPPLKPSGERRSLLTLLLLIALTAAAFFYLAERPRRYAVFAGYSADGSVAPYVLRYLSGLKAVTDGIVYITDSPLSPEAQKQVAPYVIHGEY